MNAINAERNILIYTSFPTTLTITNRCPKYDKGSRQASANRTMETGMVLQEEPKRRKKRSNSKVRLTKRPRLSW